MDGVDDESDDVSAFDRFFLAARGSIMQQMVMFTGDVAEAEDVTQEAFEKAWLRWATVRQCESPEAWVRTVAGRLAVSRWRKLQHAKIAWLRREDRPAAEELGPGGVALMIALKALPESQRRAIVLHHLADLPITQIAEETGASVAAVEQRLARGRAALAPSLADDRSPGRPETLARRETP